MTDGNLNFHERRQVVATEYNKAFVALDEQDRNLTTLIGVLSADLNIVIGNRQPVDVESVVAYNESVKMREDLWRKATKFVELENAYAVVLRDISGTLEAVFPVVTKEQTPSTDGGEKGSAPPQNAGKKDDVPPPEHGNPGKPDESLSAGEKRVLEVIVASKQYKKLGGPARLLALITSTSLASRWFTSIELCRHVRALDPQFFVKNNDIFFALNGATSSQTKFFDKKPATKEDIKELKSPRAQYLYRMNDDGKLHVKKFWAKYLRGTKK